MKYKITIYEIIEASGDEKYDKEEKIYEQRFNKVNIAELVKSANDYEDTV